MVSRSAIAATFSKNIPDREVRKNIYGRCKDVRGVQGSSSDGSGKVVRSMRRSSWKEIIFSEARRSRVSIKPPLVAGGFIFC